MVTVQDIGLQLTKPVKELARWNFPFSQTLEIYCSLFNTTCNKSFGEAGLVLQNSTAVYVHRIDSLWSKTECCRSAFVSHEQEEEKAKNSTKRRDKKTDACFHKFKTINFVEEVDKNIDIKKNVAQDSVKSKSRQFTQLEKNSAQNFSIDIYDVNGEIIGKKYDFRCNQNISMDGILVDEFAPQDFYCGDVSAKENSLLNYSYGFNDTSVSLTSTTCDNNEHVNTDAESERDYDSPDEEISDLVTSLELNQQNLSLSRDTETDNTLVKTPTNISSDSCHDITLTNASNETCPNTSDTSSPIITDIDNTVSLNNTSEEQCLNNNIKGTIDVGSLLDSPPESVNSRGRRTSSIDDPALLNDTNGDLTKSKSLVNSIQNTSLHESKKNKMKQRSTSKSTPKALKRKLPVSCKKQLSKMKTVLNSLEDLYYSRDRSSMFKKPSRICMKYIKEYDPLQYKDVSNAELDFLGFRLRDDTESNADINDDVTTNINDNIMTSINDVTTNVNDNIMTSIDDEISEPRSPSPMDISSPRENFCDVWFRSDSPQFLPEKVDKWHEMIQPKLRDAEQRSTFCIRDYASRIVETLKASDQRRVSFDNIIQKEHPCEVARYFLASLDLASKQNVNINTNGDPENNIEIILCEEDKQCSTNSQADSHD